MPELVEVKQGQYSVFDCRVCHKESYLLWGDVIPHCCGFRMAQKFELVYTREDQIWCEAHQLVYLEKCPMCGETTRLIRED